MEASFRRTCSIKQEHRVVRRQQIVQPQRGKADGRNPEKLFCRLIDMTEAVFGIKQDDRNRQRAEDGGRICSPRPARQQPRRAGDDRAHAAQASATFGIPIGPARAASASPRPGSAIRLAPRAISGS